MECNENVYELTETECSRLERENCIGIFEITEFSAPSCSSDTTLASNKYELLNKYITETRSHAERMIIDIGTTLETNKANGSFTETN